MRPARPNSLPSASWTVKSPSMRMDPLLKIVTFVGIFPMLPDYAKRYRISAMAPSRLSAIWSGPQWNSLCIVLAMSSRVFF